MLFRKPVNLPQQQLQQQQQQQQSSTPPPPAIKPSSLHLTSASGLNQLGTPANHDARKAANEDAHSPSPRRVTIVEDGVAMPTRAAGGSGGGGAGSGRSTPTTPEGRPVKTIKESNLKISSGAGGVGFVGGGGGNASSSASTPSDTPPSYNNRNGQPPNAPPSRFKESNPISSVAPPPNSNAIIGGRGKTPVYAYDDDDGGRGGGGGGGVASIITSARRPSAPRGSSIESGGSGGGGGGGRLNNRPESGVMKSSVGVDGGERGGGVVGGGGGGYVGGVTFAPTVMSDDEEDLPPPRSRSVERDLDEFVRSCSVSRTARARSVATGRSDGDGEVLSRLDALINDVVNTSSTSHSRGRSRGRSPGGNGGAGGGGGGGGRSASVMTRSSYDPKNFDLAQNASSPETQQQQPPPPMQQRVGRGRSMMRDAELDRLQRDVTSMTRSTPKARGVSVARDYGVAREFSVARELSMGREFAPPVESTVSKVYVSSLEPTDKICLKVRAAIQREVTMTNKKVDLVWNKIQTLKETNDIMEETICQTEDELCYCEELTDAVGLDLTDILTDAEDREQLLNYELQLLQEVRRVQEEGAEGGDADGVLDGDGGCSLDGSEGGVDDPLQKRSSINAMKKKAQKKFTRLKRRESEDIMNSTRCKIS